MIKLFFFIFMFHYLTLCSQNTPKLTNFLDLEYDSMPQFTFINRIGISGCSDIYHSPEEKDKHTVRKYAYLLTQEPNSKNYHSYYELGCSYWELEKIAEAEKIFLTIISSNEKYYRNTYCHNSDISGDTTTNIYGYGSFTSNYKNEVAQYLCKIYIEKKQYKLALQYLNDAVKKYKVQFNCGTGANRQKEEYDFLYAKCYDGLNMHKEIIELLMPNCFNRHADFLTKAIQKVYSQDTIIKELESALNSIEFVPDTFRSGGLITYYSDKNVRYDSLYYYSGVASLIIWGKKLNIPTHFMNYEKNERLTKEKVIAKFKESVYYYNLSRNE